MRRTRRASGVGRARSAGARVMDCVTRRLVFALAVLAICLMLSFRVEHAYVAASGVVAIIVVGCAWPIVVARTGRLRIGTMADRVRVGERIPLVLEWTGVLPIHVNELACSRSAAADDELTLRRNRTTRLELLTARRGVFELSDTVAFTTYPLGLFRARVRSIASGRVVVWPKAIETELPASTPRTHVDLSDECSTRSGDDELIGLRSYRRGDPLKLVHWQQTARYDRLIVRQRSGSTRQIARITLDSRRDSFVGREDLFEQCVSVFAGLVERAVVDGITVDLTIAGDRTLVRRADEIPLAMDRLAAVELVDSPLPQAFGVLVTTTQGEASAGSGWVCLCVDRVSSQPTERGAAA